MTYREMMSADITDWPNWARSQARLAIDDISRRVALARKTPSTTVWDVNTIATLVNRLSVSNGAVQAKAIQKAIENGGTVSRAEVYALGGYDADRSLKGFTRPVNRIVEEMKGAGELPEEAESPFEPIYDENGDGYQQAQGFRVPIPVVEAYTAT